MKHLQTTSVLSSRALFLLILTALCMLSTAASKQSLFIEDCNTAVRHDSQSRASSSEFAQHADNRQTNSLYLIHDSQTDGGVVRAYLEQAARHSLGYCKTGLCLDISMQFDKDVFAINLSKCACKSTSCMYLAI